TRGAEIFSAEEGTAGTAATARPGENLPELELAAAASRNTVPAGHSRPSAFAAVRRIETLPLPRSAALIALAPSGLPGRLAAAPLGASAAGSPKGRSPAGSVAFSTVTPIIRGSVHAATS